MIDKAKCISAQILLMHAPMEYLRHEKNLRKAIEEEYGYRFKSNFEASMAVALYSLDIPYTYAQTKFHFTLDNKVITYTPDFVLGMKHENSQILIEPHGSSFINERFITKMNTFMSTRESDLYYTILVTDKRPKKPNKLKIELNRYGYTYNDICDDVWYIPYAVELGVPISTRTGMGSIFSMLRGLKEREDVSIMPESVEMLKSRR